MEPEIRDLVGRVSERLLEQGAVATVVTGSHARGTATAESDVDVFAVGDGPSQRFEWHDGRLVSIHWWTPDEARQRMQRPESALVSVAGWKDAVVVDDPSGVAAELQREAREWSWERIDREADAWVAERLVGWAEYVHKLVAALDSDRLLDACAIRAETAIRVGEVFAVHRRLTFETENGLWEAVARADGAEWEAALVAAFARDGQDPHTSATAALALYSLLAREAGDLLRGDQRVVIDHALDAARRWLDRPATAAMPA